jgi:hypothetical protein
MKDREGEGGRENEGGGRQSRESRELRELREWRKEEGGEGRRREVIEKVEEEGRRKEEEGGGRGYLGPYGNDIIIHVYRQPVVHRARKRISDVPRANPNLERMIQNVV